MIDIVLCTDENYAAYCSVVMVSALKNTVCPEMFHFHVLTPNLTSLSQEKMNSLVTEYGAKLSIYEADTGFFDSVKADLGRFGIGTLLRLYMDHYLPQECERVIYLDCDLLILGDLAKLSNVNLNGNVVGGVPDLCSPQTFKSREYEYFNAGVLVIDLGLWREKNIAQLALDYLSNHNAKYLDQDALNYIFQGQWKILDISWNMQPAAYTAYDKKYDYIPRKQIEEAVHFPNIVHFIGPVKPWHANCTHPLQQLFLDFSNFTPWPISQKDLRAQISWTKRINRLFKHLKITKRRKLTKYQL